MSFKEFKPTNHSWFEAYRIQERRDAIHTTIAVSILTVAFPILYCIFGAFE